MSEIIMQLSEDDVDPIVIDRKTGRVINATLISPDATTLTRQENDRRKRYGKLMKRRRVSKQLGDFIFVHANDKYVSLPPETLARITMLATHMNYKQKLMKTLRTPLTKNMVQSVLKLSKTPFYNLWKTISPQFVQERNGELIFSDTEIVSKGAITNKSVDEIYTRIFIKQFKEIYTATPTARHRYIGYVLKLIPYLNMEYNIICQDPFEEVVDDIKPLTISEICEIVGYNKRQDANFAKIYSPGGTVDALASISDGVMLVNPMVIYSGTDVEKCCSLFDAKGCHHNFFKAFKADK